jgi:hypothetical protein
MEVVDAISTVATDGRDGPRDPITMQVATDGES